MLISPSALAHLAPSPHVFEGRGLGEGFFLPRRDGVDGSVGRFAVVRGLVSRAFPLTLALSPEDGGEGTGKRSVVVLMC